MNSKGGEEAGKKEARQLSIERAAFLILRVRRVFRKKIGGKAERSSAAQPASRYSAASAGRGVALARGTRRLPRAPVDGNEAFA